MKLSINNIIRVYICSGLIYTMFLLIYFNRNYIKTITKPEIQQHQENTKFDLHDLDGYVISYTLKKNPSLITKFTNYELNKLASAALCDLLLEHPHLYSQFNLHKLTSEHSSILLRKHPYLIDYIDINKMSERDIDDLLLYRPKLFDKFKDTLIK